MCTAELVDRSQRANVWRYVVPVVEGNAENLNKKKVLINAKHVRFFSHWARPRPLPQRGMNLWARLRPLHQRGNTCCTTNPMCKCRGCPTVVQRPDESIVCKVHRSTLVPMSSCWYFVHPHTSVTQIFTPKTRIAAGCTNGSVTTGAKTEARASSTLTV